MATKCKNGRKRSGKGCRKSPCSTYITESGYCAKSGKKKGSKRKTKKRKSSTVSAHGVPMYADVARFQSKVARLPCYHPDRAAEMQRISQAIRTHAAAVRKTGLDPEGYLKRRAQMNRLLKLRQKAFFKCSPNAVVQGPQQVFDADAAVKRMAKRHHVSIATVRSMRLIGGRSPFGTRAAAAAAVAR